MNYDQLFAGRFLKAGEFNGKPVTLTIARVYLEDMEQDDGTEKHQAVVAFKETKRELALNKTNAQMIVAMFGAESDDWIGHKMTLHAERDTSGKSDSGLCIRVLGSPELTSTISMQVKLPRRKAINRKLVPTAKVAAPVADEFAEIDAPAPASPISGPLTLRCTGCGATVPASVDATADDLVGVCCDKCGAGMAVAS